MSFKKIGFGITISEVDCGLHVITKKTPGKLVYAAFCVRGGASHDNICGEAHLAEHCALDGIRKEAVGTVCTLSSDYEISRFVEGMGAEIGASTDHDGVSYSLDFNKRDLKTMIDILLKVGLMQKLSDRSIERQKKIVCAELAKCLENPLENGIYDEMLRSLIFKVNPIRNPSGGRIEDILTITPDMIRRRFKRFNAPNNAALVVVGPVEHGDIVKLVQKFENEYGAWLPEQVDTLPTIDPALFIESKQQRQTTIWESDHFKHLTFYMGYSAPTLLSKDYIPIKILSGIMGDYSSSRLFRTFRERWGKSYFAESKYSASPRHGEFILDADFFSAPGESSQSVIDRAQEFVVKQIRDLRSGNISKWEFEHVKETLYNNNRKLNLEDAEYVRSLLEESFESNEFESEEAIITTIKRELDTPLRITRCSMDRFIRAIERSIHPTKYALVVSGSPGCYKVNDKPAS